MMDGHEIPLAIGISRDVAAPTSNDEIDQQVETVRAKKGFNSLPLFKASSSPHIPKPLETSSAISWHTPEFSSCIAKKCKKHVARFSI